jgi:hypothetical protein
MAGSKPRYAPPVTTAFASFRSFTEGSTPMHAIVTRSTIHDYEEARKTLQEEGIPRISQAPGFVGAYFARVGENAGAGMIVFESEEAAQALAEQLKTNPPGGGAITIERIEVGEVTGRA